MANSSSKHVRSKLSTDLVVAFGFSQLNAQLAIDLYRGNKLSQKEQDVLFYLETKRPFSGPVYAGKPMPTLPVDGISTLERLNYKLTCVGGNAV